MTLRHRKAAEADLDLYYTWANDPMVRTQSFNQAPISYETHCAWYRRNLSATGVMMLVFEDAATGDPVGQVRIEQGPERATIGVSVAESHRGKGLASVILAQATAEFHRAHPAVVVRAYVRVDNAASRRAFEKAGYAFRGHASVLGVPSLVLERARGTVPFPTLT